MAYGYGFPVVSVLMFLHFAMPLTEAMSPFRMMSERPVSILDQSNFRRELELGGKRQWMVAFCEGFDRSGAQPEPIGDCRKLMPAFEKYAKEKTNQAERLAYGEVDCSVSPELCEELQAVPGSIVHFVAQTKVDSWTKRRQREGTLLFPWINQQVDAHEAVDGSISKAVFKEASKTPWDTKGILAVNIIFVVFLAIPAAAAKLATSATWMLSFVGTLFLAVATLRLLSCPLLLPGSPSAKAAADARRESPHGNGNISSEASSQNVLY